VATESQQFGPAHTLFGIEAAAQAAGQLLSFVTMDSDDAMETTLDRLRASHVDGVIVIAPVRGILRALSDVNSSVPLVVVGADMATGLPTVTIDPRDGARQATVHLLELGHATVHHVRGPKDWIDANGRVRGWSDALSAAGARPIPPLTGDWGAGGGYAAGSRLAADPDVTAIFAANDQMALGVVRALHDAGRRVPTDVSVVGFDDTPESAYFVPALTTIRQDFAEVGRRSVKLLRSMMEGHEVSPNEVVPTQLILRESTARR
jgi:DNA-binding LacI/PurR family transcriptional regulator